MKGENLYILVEAINMFLMIIKQESKEKSNERVIDRGLFEIEN